MDGTRFCKVKFTEIVQSLPYSTKFETLEGGEYFRVIHDKQVRVCRLCIQSGHIVKDWGLKDFGGDLERCGCLGRR